MITSKAQLLKVMSQNDGSFLFHCYQESEDENEWNYVKMTEDFDVISEKTFALD